MPRTARSSFVPVADVSANASPTARPCSFAQPSSTIAPSSPSAGGHRVVALDPVEAPAVAADRVDRLLLAERERPVLVDGRDVHAGARERLADRRVGRRPAVRARDHVLGRDPVLERARGSCPSGPAATTVTSVTSATPIVSAVAVVIVRPGWRIALRRASPPAAPPTAWAGRPRSDGQRAHRPRREAHAAGARARRHAAPRPGARASRATPAAGRRRASRPCRRAARRRSCARRTRCPPRAATSSIASNSASSAFARPRPATRPTTRGEHADARAPRPAPTPSTWRRAAPTIRSSPSSRVRWATVIESVLKMVNAPTRIATPPNTSSAIRMIEMNCSSPSSVKRSCSAAVTTCACGQRRGEVACAAARPGTPRVAGDEDPVDLVAAAEQLLRGREVEDGGRRDAHRLHAAEARDADDLEVVRDAARGDLHGRADAVVLVLGRRGVDDDLARAGGPAAAGRAGTA